MIHQPFVPADVSLAVSRPCLGPDPDRAALPLVLRMWEGNSTHHDYPGYVVSTMLLGPMLGYGTRLEPLMALGSGGFWGLHAAIHLVGASRRRHQPVN